MPSGEESPVRVRPAAPRLRRERDRRARPFNSWLLSIGVFLVAATLLLTMFSAMIVASGAAAAAPAGSFGPVPSAPLGPISGNTAVGYTASATATGLRVSITATPAYGLAPVVADFTSRVAGGTTPYTYSWQFGDGGSSSAADPDHTYTAANSWLVTLTVTDHDGTKVSTDTFVSSATTAASTLSLSTSLGPMSSIYWGYNYDYEVGASSFDNATIASDVEKTPIVWLRLPLAEDGYGPAESWGSVAKFCATTHCEEIATVGGPGVSVKEAVDGMKRAVAYGLDPAYWAFGNEPDLWASAGDPTSGLQYADIVQSWIQLAKVTFPHAKFIGAEVTGHSTLGDSYIYNVTKVDGSLISAIGIQLYPQWGGTTPADFLKSLTVANSVGAGIPRVAALMKSACSSCSIPILLSEFQGGSGENPNYVPFREGFPDATFFAASIVQGLSAHLAQFMPWTLAGAPDGLTIHPGDCDMGLIALNSSCADTTFSPVYYLYSNLLTKFPFGTLTEISDADATGLYGIQVTNGTRTVDLVVNANPSVTQSLALGSGFPTKGTVTSYLMDLEHITSPLTSTQTIGTTTTVAIPPMGIAILNFSSKGTTGPSTYPVTGRVVNTAGAPLASATVSYTLNGKLDSVAVNAEGNFTVSLPNGTYHLTVAAPGYVSDNKSVTVNGRSVATGHIVLAKTNPTFPVTGRVTDLSDTPLAGAIVAYSLEGKPKSVISDADGYFTALVPDGTYTLNVSASGYISESVKVTVDGAAVDVGRIALPEIPPDFALTGRVTDSIDVPLAGATLAYSVDGKPKSVVTDGAGYFVAQVPDGTYILNVSAAGYVSQSVKATVDGATEDVGRIALVEVPPDFPVTGRVANAAGVPIGSATVSYWAASGHKVVDVNGAGYFSLELADGTYVLTVAASGYVAQKHSVTVDGTTTFAGHFALAQSAHAPMVMDPVVTQISQRPIPDALVTPERSVAGIVVALMQRILAPWPA
jgi:PKD repeat protein